MAYRVIFHIDMNCFFASCEIAEHPELKGHKIAVAHDSLDKKGIVLTASYEAKNLGIKTTMPLYEALRICPDLEIIEPHYETYELYSSYFFKYLKRLTPLVEPASIDEGYVDVTDLCEVTEYFNLAKKIQDDLLNLYHLPCSIGIAPNKFLAKMASDMKKPLGITILRKKDIETMMYPLPIEDFFGAGKKTCAVLHNLGVNTIGDLSKMPKDILETAFGSKTADYLTQHVMGNGSNIVDPHANDSCSSISHAHTLDHNEYNLNNIILEIKILVNTVASKLVEQNLLASTFTLSLKFDDFTAISKAISISNATNDAFLISHHLVGILETVFTGEKGVRLISCAVSKLSPNVENDYKQLTLFDSMDKEEQNYEVDKTINYINSIIGDKTLVKGTKKIINK